MKQLLFLLLFLFTHEIVFAQETTDEFGKRLSSWMRLTEEEKKIDKNAIVFGEKDVENLIKIIKKGNLAILKKEEEDKVIIDVKNDKDAVINSVCKNLINSSINPKEIKYLFIKSQKIKHIDSLNLVEVIKGYLFFLYMGKIFKMDFEAIRYANFYKLHRANNIWEMTCE